MPEPLRTIGRYQIQRELGRGMMGVVYEAHDPALGRKVALKTIQLAFAVSDDERRTFDQRFLTEARIAARLSHPGIVVVHDVGQDPTTGTLYMALEFLQGRTLAEVVADGKPVDWREALEITRRVAGALHHAHAAGVVHRDIKPANIMMLPSGEPKIMDFGIAKLETGQLTATGQFFGTPLYMSPEQALGRKLDARSDLFSLGALAYGLLTGQHAFGGPSVPRIVTRVIQEDPPPPTHALRSLPPEVDYVIARALAKDPADRYPDGNSMAEDVADILAGQAPRHRRSWEAPPRAEGTLVSLPGEGRADRAGGPATRPGTEDGLPGLSRSVSGPEPRAARRTVPPPRAPRAGTTAPAPGLPARRPPAPHPRRPGWKAVASVAALASAATIAAIVAARARPGPVPGTPDTASATTLAGPTTTPVASPAPPLETRPPPPPAPATTPPEPEASPRARPVPSRTEAEQPALPVRPVTAAERVQLAIDFEHSLKAGRLRVWVDDTLVVEEELDSRVTRKIASLKLRKGSVEETLEIDPGRHEIRVEVAWGDSVKTGRIWATFEPGSTRRLAARLGGGIGGLVRKSLDLEWETERAPE